MLSTASNQFSNAILKSLKIAYLKTDFQAGKYSSWLSVYYLLFVNNRCIQVLQTSFCKTKSNITNFVAKREFFFLKA